MKKIELSTVQNNIIMLERFHGNTTINNIISSLTFKEKIPVELLNKAYNIVVKQNDLMKAKFIDLNDKVECVVDEKNKEEYKLRVTDFTNETEEDVREYLKHITATSINMFEEAVGAEIIYLPNKKTMVVNKNHHIVGDAWSIVSLISNNYVEVVYKLLNGEEVDGTKYISPSYDILTEREKAYMSSVKFEEDKKYWDDILNEETSITSIKTANININYKSSRITKTIDEELTKRIKEYCKENKISEYTFMLTTLAVYLARTLQKEDILIGTPILNRLTAKEKNTLGLFVSAIPLKFKIDENETFLDLAKIVSAQMFTSYRHIKYPLNEIAKEFYKHAEVKKLFNISLSYQNATYNGPIAEKNVEAIWYNNSEQQEQLIVHVLSHAEENKLRMHYDYLVNLFTEKEINYIHERMLEIMKDAVSFENKIKDMRIMSKEEEKLILEKYSGLENDISYPKKETIMSIFEKMVKKYPDNVAIRFKDEELTYTQLDKKVNALATHIRKCGIDNKSIVAIKLERGINQIIAILATLKAGAAYMPIHEDWPDERIMYMLEDSKAKFAITTSKYMQTFESINEYNNNMLGEDLVLDIEEFFEKTDVRDYKDLELISNPSDVAYVIYTSGTTGKPKGTLVKNENVIVLLKSKNFPLDVSEKDIWSLFHAYTFDVSVFEIFGALLNGAKLLIVPGEYIRNIDAYVELLVNEKVTVFNQTPSMLYNVIEALKSVNGKLSTRYITIGGETLHTTKLKEFHETNKDLNLIIAYGMTETAVVTTFYKIKEEDFDKDTLKIGTPLPFKNVHILDKNAKILPLEVEGELCETGPAVSLGYISNEDLTRKKFINTEYSKYKTYRSGDVAKLDIDGNIIYIGRNDNQVKIRGFRIELEEIEKILLKLEGISKVLVFAKNQKIYAFLEKEKNGKKVLKKNVKEELLKLIPAYMMPDIYMVDKFKYTINGKIDRNDLMQLVKTENENRVVEKPKNEKEKEILAVIVKELDRTNLGVTDNFAEQNIDSLEVLKTVLELRKKGYIIAPQDMYEAGNIRMLAEKISKESKTNSRKNKTLNYEKINMTSKKQDMTNVLLTGSTGFLGLNLLEELIEDEKVEKIYCLVRNSKEISGFEKLDKKYKEFFGRKLTSKKVEKVLGDISEERLGLAEDKYNELRQKITVVLNSAANIKYYGDYNKLYKTNVESVENIIEFVKGTEIGIAQISTESVAGFSDVNEDLILTEDKLDMNQYFLDNIYMLTKFEAEEKLIQNMFENKTNTKIFRMGNLMPRSDSGKFQSNSRDNTFMQVVNAITKIKCICNEILDADFDLTPVDIAAKSVCTLMKKTNSMNIYHISNKKMKTKEIIKDIEELGEKIEVKTRNEFLEKLKENKDEIVEILIVKNMFNEYKIVGADSTKTIEILKQNDIYFNKAKKDYIEKILKIVKGWR